MGCGMWAMAYGTWAMAYGMWHVGDDIWNAAAGKGAMERGIWNGQRAKGR